jgi:hypothetical protein
MDKSTRIRSLKRQRSVIMGMLDEMCIRARMLKNKLSDEKLKQAQPSAEIIKEAEDLDRILSKSLDKYRKKLTKIDGELGDLQNDVH